MSHDSVGCRHVIRGTLVNAAQQQPRTTAEMDEGLAHCAGNYVPLYNKKWIFSWSLDTQDRHVGIMFISFSERWEELRGNLWSKCGEVLLANFQGSLCRHAISESMIFHAKFQEKDRQQNKQNKSKHVSHSRIEEELLAFQSSTEPKKFLRSSPSSIRIRLPQIQLHHDAMKAPKVKI
ncbi:hypothetical protein SBOR_0121 [Sclerotinia borealis F-4128]|uniref:Uncharacterized protein n=1 Tax=Sclerotinia borealis (strain F-4128) TaxID=1432307 RepID=W9CUH5_SCLBF|nr:hypothetical protein SBOR_0121 [Sclerotinia borealis F-4128]